MATKTIADLNASAIGRPFWTAAPFWIVTTNGPREEEGLVRGFFGVQRNFATDEYVLTHLPTGASFARHTSKDKLKNAAKKVEGLCDWSFTSMAGFPTGGDRRAVSAVLDDLGLLRKPEDAPKTYWNDEAAAKHGVLTGGEDA